MIAYEFVENDKVLLLGEGNFSFSVNLLRHLSKKENRSSFPNVCVTCYENEVNSDEMRQNVNALIELGNFIFNPI